MSTVHLEAWMAQLLQDALPGSKVRALHGGHVIRHPDGSTTVIEAKALSAVRREDLIGRLATGVLQLESRTEGDAAVIVAVPRASPAAAGVAEAFMAKHAPEVGWGLVDRAGSVHLELPSRGVSLRTNAERPRGEHPASPPALFSDLNAWLLKLLLLRDVEPPLWNGSRHPIRSVRDLQRAGDVARITAYRFANTFERADFLRRSAGLEIVRRGELLRAWLAHSQLMRVRELPVRSIRRRGAGAKDIFTNEAGLRWAIGGFAAAAALGVRHASHGVAEVHVDADIDDALRAWDLARCERRDAEFILLLSPRAESIFRGASRLPEGSVVDVLQSALDVVRHPTRGKEQSQHILHEALGWREV